MTQHVVAINGPFAAFDKSGRSSEKGSALPSRPFSVAGGKRNPSRRSRNRRHKTIAEMSGLAS